jgi:hypothetical protein
MMDSRFKAALDSLVYLSPAQPRPAPSGTSDRPAWRLGDRSDFLRRLCTFRPSLWCAKPDIVGPVACARRGWVAHEPDLIACEVRARTFLHHITVSDSRIKKRVST